MTISLIILCLILCIREISFMHERKQWQDERKDLINRIQAGTLRDYQQATTPPSAPIIKSREQRIAERCEELGVPRSDLQYPPQWK